MNNLIASKGAVQYMLRLSPDLRERIHQRAETNGRSMNTEIVAAIEQHLTQPSLLDRVDVIERTLAALVERQVIPPH